jgi:hypothetical protein
MNSSSPTLSEIELSRHLPWMRECVSECERYRGGREIERESLPGCAQASAQAKPGKAHISRIDIRLNNKKREKIK